MQVPTNPAIKHPSSRRARLFRLASTAGATATMVAATVIGVGCVAAGGSSPPDPLPAAFRGQTLVTPAVVGYPPYAMTTKATGITGIDPDLSRALSVPLGQKVNLKITSFETSLLGLQRGIYFMVTGATITATREKTFDMVSYMKTLYEFMWLAGKPALGTSLTSLCGLTISTVAADTSIPVLKTDSQKCTAAGKSPITTTTFPTQGEAVLAVESGRANATTATVTNLGYVSVQHPGKFRIGGPKYNYLYIGIATKKGNGVAQALAKAINYLIKDGKYHQILAKYDVTSGAVPSALVNPNPNSA